MLTSKDLDVKYFPASPDIHLKNLYSRTSSVLILHESGIGWSAYSFDLSKLIGDEHEIAHVSCFTVNHRDRRM